MLHARMLRSNLCNCRKRGPSWILLKRNVEKRYSRQSGQQKLANKTSARNFANLKRRCERQSSRLNFVARKSSLHCKKRAIARVVSAKFRPVFKLPKMLAERTRQSMRALNPRLHNKRRKPPGSSKRFAFVSRRNSNGWKSKLRKPPPKKNVGWRSWTTSASSLRPKPVAAR